MKSRRSGFSLVLIGLLGAAFFWLTDPKLGVRWLNLRPGENPIDATHDAAVATYVGLSACALIVLIGLVLLARRTA